MIAAVLQIALIDLESFRSVVDSSSWNEYH